MKKFTSILLVFASIFILFGLSAKPVNAFFDFFGGCSSAGPYNTQTGQLCVNPTNVVGCQPGFPFSPVTGQSCNTSNLPPGCSSTLGYSPITGQSCNNNGFNFPPGCSSSQGFSITTGQSCNGSYFPPPTYPPGCFSTFGFSTIDGQSCGVFFNSQQLIISGVNGPQSLNVNQQATWNVTAYDQNGGNLSYSVNWGDQVSNIYGSFSQPQFLSQQSATFTHVYSQSGFYTPVFTVTNSRGQTAQTSLSVNVGGSSFSSLNILTNSVLPSGRTNSSYYATISGSGGTGNYTWNMQPNNLMCVSSLSCGLPPGLTLSQIYQPCVFGAICPSQATITGTPLAAGTYTFGITLRDGSGTSIGKTFTMSIFGGSSQTPNISFLSPASGAVGTQVTIFGSGFSGGTVNFGSFPLPTSNISDSQTAFIVPSHLNNSCVPGILCAQIYIPVNPGLSYPISVTNNNGVSNSLNFVVANF